MIGQTLAHYRILEKIGEGGMGVVYRAHDERLERDVALKVLPAGLLADEPAQRRFRKEALALSRLNHANIALVYDFDVDAGNPFLVMELVPGHPLADKLSQGPLAEKEVASLGAQIADALEEAHERGIVHRDLKPGNVLVTPKGRAKVLDFGLAKLLHREEAGERTQSLDETRAVAGTLAYMAPEQLRGEPVDARTDLYALGGVLYEMATGQRASGEKLPSRLADAILHQLPVSPRALNARVSTEMERIILKCLEKDPENRYQSAKEIAVDLRRLGSPSSTIAAPVAAATKISRPLIYLSAAIGAAVLLVAAGAFLAARWKHQNAPLPEQYVQLTNFNDSATSPALSPDGKMLAFIRGRSTFEGQGEIYVKMLPDGEPVQLSNDATNKMGPAFSPEGARIAFTRIQQWNWDTWAVSVLGGTPQALLPNASGLTWVGPGQVMFSEITTGINMKVVSATESRAEERDVYRPPGAEIAMAHRSYLSPDHKWVLIAEMDNRGWLPCRLVPFDGSSSGHRVGPSPSKCTGGAWSPDGKWIYLSANSGGGFHTWRQNFPDGTPEQITFGATEEQGIAVAPDGLSFITSVGIDQSTIWLHETKGDCEISSQGYAYTPMFSPDGSKLYYLLRSGTSRAFLAGELWLSDLVSGRRERLLPGFDVTRYDLSADGSRIVFAAIDSGGISSLWLASLDRRFPPRQLTTTEAFRPFFAPAGEIFFLEKDGDADYVYRMKEDGSGKERIVPEPVIYLISCSPDRKWVVVWAATKDPVNTQVVIAYPTQGGAPKIICTKCGASGPANLGAPSVSWSRDQKNLYFPWSASFMGGRKTYRIALAPGAAFPSMPNGGIQSEKDVLTLPGVHAIEQADVFPGPDPSVYAFTRTATHRNLYRIQLPH